MIYFTSDLHLCHNREFLYSPRGFTSIDEMNKAIIEGWKDITDEDDVYILGDLMLNDTEEGMRILSSLKGRLHIIIGNHDSNVRINLYKTLPNLVEEPKYSTVIKYKKYKFYLCHYPTITINIGNNYMSGQLICLYGHTHQKTNFYNDCPFMYHVGMDSHNCKPVSIEEIIQDCKNKLNGVDS